MKRFTETSKWMDPWYRKLSSSGKLIWQYLCDTCDLIGLADFDLELAAIDLGCKVKTDWHVEFGDRIQLVGTSKVFITKFIDFQYGELSPDCPPHRKIIKAVTDRGLVRDSLGYRYPSNTLSVGFQYPTGKEEEKDRKGRGKEEGDVGGEPALPVEIPKLPNKAVGTQDEIREFCASLGLAVTDADYCFNKWVGNGWKNGGEKIKDWKATVRSWKAAGYLPSAKGMRPPQRRGFQP